MKLFDTFTLSKRRARKELREFKDLLDDPARTSLSEEEDILPFFRSHRHLAALIGAYNPNICRFDRIADEFDIFGDHVADLAVGDSKEHQYCFVEFEDAAPTSIFKKTAAKATPEWSRRFEHGFSQIIDWILWLENQKNTVAYTGRFGVPSIQYVALLVIGREEFLSEPALRERLRWRDDQVFVAGKKVNCITFDRLYGHIKQRLDFLGG